MKRLVFYLGCMVAVTFIQIGCGGSAVTGPSGSGGGGGGSADVVITIVAQNGSLSFSPNPASVTAGQTVAWKNNDSTTHNVVQDGGAFNTGNLLPGATSAPITITATTALPYHCSIHPTMVGTINGTSSGTGGPQY